MKPPMNAEKYRHGFECGIHAICISKPFGKDCAELIHRGVSLNTTPAYRNGLIAGLAYGIREGLRCQA